MMKQILNEWRKFLSEGRNPGIDDQLGVHDSMKFGDGFFGRFDNATGVFQALPGQAENVTSKFKLEWQEYITQNYPNVRQELENKIKDTKKKIKKLSKELKSSPKKSAKFRRLKKEGRVLVATLREDEKTLSDWIGGYSYGTFKLIGPAEAEKLIRHKIKQYVHEAPKEDVRFMFANLDRILNFAKETMTDHRYAPTQTGFYGRHTDWWMFGDGIDITSRVMQQAKLDFIGSQSEPLPEPTEPEPIDLVGNVSDERSKELSDQAAFFNDFYEKNPQFLNPTTIKPDEDDKPRNRK